MTRLSSYTPLIISRATAVAGSIDLSELAPAKLNINITSVDIKVKDSVASARLIVQVSNIKQLDRVLKKVSEVKSIDKISRIQN